MVDFVTEREGMRHKYCKYSTEQFFFCVRACVSAGATTRREAALAVGSDSCASVATRQLSTLPASCLSDRLDGDRDGGGWLGWG